MGEDLQVRYGEEDSTEDELERLRRRHCRYGAACTRRDCVFKHPEDRVLAPPKATTPEAEASIPPAAITPVGEASTRSAATAPAARAFNLAEDGVADGPASSS